METKKIKQFVTKCYQEKDNFCWYNINKKLTDEELDDLIKYFNNNNYNFMLIINGCNELRPQRTWGTLPTFLKGTDGCHIISKSIFNSFVLFSWLEPYDEYKNDISELLQGLEDLEITYLTKEGESVEKIRSEVSKK